MKILVPLDGSAHSDRALETALCLAQRFAGQITLIHIEPSGVPKYALPTHAASAREERQYVSKKMMESARKTIEAGGVPVNTVFKMGHVVEQILMECNDVDYDLVVMGARGISRIKELFLGSVSDGVTRHGTRPVLVVK